MRSLFVTSTSYDGSNPPMFMWVYIILIVWQYVFDKHKLEGWRFRAFPKVFNLALQNNHDHSNGCLQTWSRASLSLKLWPQWNATAMWNGHAIHFTGSSILNSDGNDEISISNKKVPQRMNRSHQRHIIIVSSYQGPWLTDTQEATINGYGCHCAPYNLCTHSGVFCTRVLHMLDPFFLSSRQRRTMIFSIDSKNIQVVLLPMTSDSLIYIELLLRGIFQVKSILFR